MKFNLEKHIKSIVGKKLDGKVIRLAFLTECSYSGDIVLRIHFSEDDYMDHKVISLNEEIELTE
jgi:hypothetical protein